MKKYWLLILGSIITNFIYAQTTWTSGRPDGHAPIGVMGDHTHGRGEWMFSYRFMQMNMKDFKQGTTSVESHSLVDDYMMVPHEMKMSMHMLGLMYALSDQATLMVMTNYQSLSMEMGMTNASMVHQHFDMESSGIGDTRVTFLGKILDKKGQRIHINMGLSIPTGSIEQKAVTPMSEPNETQLPYPMQTGSGTYTLLPGVTYLGQSGNISWGGQLMSTLQLNENSHQYKWGNEFGATTWLGYPMVKWLSGSIRLLAHQSGKIDGSDPSYMNPMMSPTLSPANFGGTSVKAAIGLNTYLQDGILKGFRWGIEYQLPVYQNLNGTQMKLSSIATVGVQYSL